MTSPSIVDTPARGEALQRPANYAAAFLMDVVFGCVGLGLSLLGTHHFKLGYTSLAMLFATGGFSACVGCLFLSRLSDRFGRRPVILAVLGGVTVTSFLFGVASAAWQLYVLVAINSCLMGTFWPSLEARITDGADGRELTRRLGAFGVFFCAGLMFGDPIAGFLAQWHLRAPFFVASGITLFLLAILALVFRLDTTHDGHHAGAAAGDNNEADEVLPGDAARKAFLLAAWAGNAVIYAVTAVLMRLFPRFATLLETDGGLGFTFRQAGLIGGAAPFAMLCMFVVLGRLHFWHYKFRYLAAGQVVAICSLLMYALSSSFSVLVLASFLFGLGRGVTYIASIYYSLHGQAARAGQSGLHEAVLCFGYATGMIVTGLMATVLTSHRAPYWICIVAVAGAIAAEWLILRRGKRAEAE